MNMIATKVHKAVLAAAVAALAFGAQAEIADPDTTTNPSSYDYSFNLSVNDIPGEMKSMSANSTLYLVKDGTILAYATVSEMIAIKAGGQTEKTVHAAQDSVTIEGKTYAVAAHTLITGTQINDVSAGDAGRVNTGFNLTFELNDRTEPLSTDINGFHKGESATDYFVNGLSLMLVGDALADDKSLVAHINKTSAIDTSVNFNGSVFSGSASVTVSNIPEPTSAMLLLLGVAGLAIKRKRA